MLGRLPLTLVIIAKSVVVVTILNDKEVDEVANVDIAKQMQEMKRNSLNIEATLRPGNHSANEVFFLAV
jgi:hypothetical protein